MNLYPLIILLLSSILILVSYILINISDAWAGQDNIYIISADNSEVSISNEGIHKIQFIGHSIVRFKNLEIRSVKVIVDKENSIVTVIQPILDYGGHTLCKMKYLEIDTNSNTIKGIGPIEIVIDRLMIVRADYFSGRYGDGSIQHMRLTGNVLMLEYNKEYRLHVSDIYYKRHNKSFTINKVIGKYHASRHNIFHITTLYVTNHDRNSLMYANIINFNYNQYMIKLDMLKVGLNNIDDYIDEMHTRGVCMNYNGLHGGSYLLSLNGEENLVLCKGVTTNKNKESENGNALVINNVYIYELGKYDLFHE